MFKEGEYDPEIPYGVMCGMVLIAMANSDDPVVYEPISSGSSDYAREEKERWDEMSRNASNMAACFG